MYCKQNVRDIIVPEKLHVHNTIPTWVVHATVTIRKPLSWLKMQIPSLLPWQFWLGNRTNRSIFLISSSRDFMISEVWLLVCERAYLKFWSVYLQKWLKGKHQNVGNSSFQGTRLLFKVFTIILLYTNKYFVLPLLCQKENN